MPESFREAVRVGVVFGGSPRVRPVWFIWNGRTVRVRSITYTWQTREGRALVRHFAVNDGVDLYELCYEPEGMGWMLAGVESGGGRHGEIQNQKSKIQMKSEPSNPKAGPCHPPPFPRTAQRKADGHTLRISDFGFHLDF